MPLNPDQHYARLDGLAARARAVLADPGSGMEALQAAVAVLGQIQELRDQITASAARQEAVNPDPMSRARTREDPGDRGAAGLRPLRKGRDQCTAHRRDGEECRAPAVPGTLVCRRHGGAAPQVLIKARHVELQAARYTAAMDFEAAKGTPREFDTLCAWGHAERELREYEAKMERLKELRAEARRLKAARGTG